MIGRSGERGSVIFVQAARHDDDDDEFLVIPRSLFVEWEGCNLSSISLFCIVYRLSKFLVFQTCGGISSRPAVFLFLIFVQYCAKFFFRKLS